MACYKRIIKPWHTPQLSDKHTPEQFLQRVVFKHAGIVHQRTLTALVFPFQILIVLFAAEVVLIDFPVLPRNKSCSES